MTLASTLRQLLETTLGRSTTRRKPIRRAPSRKLLLESLERREVFDAAFESVLGIGSDTAALLAYDNAADSAGNTYVTGILYGTMDFDRLNVRPDGSDILTPRGSQDAFVAKYSSGNSLVWARRMGSDFIRSLPNDPYEGGHGIAVDSSGNVYATGIFMGQADFGSFNLNSAGSADAYVTKLDSNGSFLWAKGRGTSTRDFASDIAVDAAGNVLAVGSKAIVYSNGAWIQNGMEIQKYNANGAAVWTKQISNFGGSTKTVATDPPGNVYIAGSFAGKVDFNPDPKKTFYVTGSSVIAGGAGANGYVLKLSSSGSFGWVSPFIAKTAESSAANVYPEDIAIDGSGSVVVGGSYKGPVDFNPSPSIEFRLPHSSSIYYDGFVEKLSPTGAFAWATPIGGGRVAGLAVDSTGVYIAGTFNEVFRPGAGIADVATNGGADVFVAQLTHSGIVDWAVTFGGTGYETCYGIDVDAAGMIHVVGNYSQTVDFDPDPLTINELHNLIFGDIYLLKLRRI